MYAQQGSTIVTGEPLDPGYRPLFEEVVEKPKVMFIAAPYACYIGNTVESVVINPQAKALLGYGYGLWLNGALQVGAAMYVGIAGEYTAGNHKNGLADGYTGTFTQVAAGPTLGFFMKPVWITASVSYVKHDYAWEVPTAPNGVLRESEQGVRVLGNVVFPLSRYIGLSGAVRLDITNVVQTGGVIGLSFSNLMPVLYVVK